MEIKHHISGDYVLTGIPNAFNEKTSWWISRRWHTKAHYCFSTSGSAQEQEKEFAYQLGALDQFHKLFEATCCSAQKTEEGDNQA